MFTRCLLLFGALLAVPALAGELPAPPEGWRPLTFRSVENATDYSNPEPGVLRAEARCAASALTYPLDPGALEREPKLSWRWQVERELAPRDERRKEGDDFAARVYVLFAFDPDRASLWERTRHRLGRQLYGEEPPGRAINYVWSHQPKGSHWESPYTDSAMLVSMGRGPLARWQTVRVDPRADYRRLFDAEAPRALAVAVMTDSDNACDHAVARYAGFGLSAPAP